MTVPVSISGLAGENATFTLTNLGSTDKALGSNGMFTAVVNPVQAKLEPVARAQSGADTARGRAIAEFNLKGYKAALQAGSKNTFLKPQASIAITVANAQLGDPYEWVDCQNVDYGTLTCLDANPYRSTTLQAKGVMPGGRTVNIWVENSEFGPGRIDPPLVNELLIQFAKTNGIGDSLRTLGGEPWGPHTYTSELIPADNQPVNVVLANLTPDGQPYGLMGYFWAVNNFQRSSVPMSNEALVVFIDSESAYLAGLAGRQALVSTLVHEGTHLTNFYRRSVQTGAVAYETWLEELTALASEDIVGSRLDAGYNSVRDSRLPHFLIGNSFNCNLTQFSTSASSCFGYSVVGSFAGYLVRQLGVPFYKTLLSSNSPSSVQALDAAIRAHRPGSSLNQELAAWTSVTAALVPNSQLPAGAGYRALTSDGFSLPTIDLQAMSPYYTPSTQSPTTLAAYGTVAWHRNRVVGTLDETVTVPAGTKLTLTVAAQPPK